jgi:hypothetical protein
MKSYLILASVLSMVSWAQSRPNSVALASTVQSESRILSDEEILVKEKLVKALSTFAEASCRSANAWRWQKAPPPKEHAEQIANCFLAGDGSPKDHPAEACTAGYTCTTNFMKAAAEAQIGYPNLGSGFQLIDKSGVYQIRGYSHGVTSVIVVPGTRAYISNAGFGQIFYLPGPEVRCQSGLGFDGCLEVN